MSFHQEEIFVNSTDGHDHGADTEMNDFLGIDFSILQQDIPRRTSQGYLHLGDTVVTPVSPSHVNLDYVHAGRKPDIGTEALQDFIRPPHDAAWTTESRRNIPYTPLDPGRSRTTRSVASIDNGASFMVPQLSVMSHTQSELGTQSWRSRDSGYQSRTATAPVPYRAGGGVDDSEASFSHYAQSQFLGDFDAVSYKAPSHSYARSFHSEETSSVYAKSTDCRVKKRQSVTKCPMCSKELKTQSDARKHEQTHLRGHRCTEQGCARLDGFATRNDLERHRKSVHGRDPEVGSKTGFVCCLCTKEGNKRSSKFWPRKDNFKAHIKRRHMSENVEKKSEDEFCTIIIKQSESTRPEGAETVELFSMMGSQMGANDERDYCIPNAIPTATPGLPEFLGPEAGIMDLTWDNANHTSLHPEPLDQFVLNFDQQDELAQPHWIDPALEPSGAAIWPGDLPSEHVVHATAGHTQSNAASAMASMFDSVGNNQEPRAIKPAPSPPKTSASSTGSPSMTGAHEGRYTCMFAKCNKVMKRSCDLKKHEKRHTRPYGCTFPDCTRKFGSRNDWKRHETTQHYLSDMWICRHEDALKKTCGHRPFVTVDALRQHLTAAHGVADAEYIRKSCAEWQLGCEGNIQFWCGFCQKIVKQNKGDLYAWKIRSDHIGDHFDKDKKVIEEWLALEPTRKSAKRKHERGRATSTRESPDADNTDEDETLSDYDPQDAAGLLEASPHSQLDIGPSRMESLVNNHQDRHIPALAPLTL